MFATGFLLSSHACPHSFCTVTPLAHPPPQLFDFDREVRPLLEVLVGKTLEQAMMEVMEEEELARLRQHQVRARVNV